MSIVSLVLIGTLFLTGEQILLAINIIFITENMANNVQLGRV
jgi:hypothetical protein